MPVAIALALVVPPEPAASTVHVKSLIAFTLQLPVVPVDPAQHPDQARLVSPLTLALKATVHGFGTPLPVFVG